MLEVQGLDVVQDAPLVHEEVLGVADGVLDEAVAVHVVVDGVDLQTAPKEEEEEEEQALVLGRFGGGDNDVCLWAGEFTLGVCVFVCV